MLMNKKVYYKKVSEIKRIKCGNNIKNIKNIKKFKFNNNNKQKIMLLKRVNISSNAVFDIHLQEKKSIRSLKKTILTEKRKN